ncbi:MAG: HpcH/HpaI aldolase family protein [Janthinobacterium lividum]
MKLRVNRIKQCLREGRLATGVNVQFASPEVVEVVGASGYDFAMIDWEHGSFSFDVVVQMIRAAEAVDITPIVRIPGCDAVTIKRVLDAGAMGVVVPQIENRAQAEEAARGARYFDGSNEGARGACPSTRATRHLAEDWQAFARHSNEEIFLALAIECEEGLRNFEEIAAVPGLDAVFLGIFDLAQAMGFHGDMKHPQVLQALQPLLAHSRARGLPIHATLVSADGDAAAKDTAYWVDAGASIINCVSDRRVLSIGLRERREAVARAGR